MPWKTEIDRLVHHLVLDSGQGCAAGEVRRAVRTLADLHTLAPDRDASHFHVGALQELVEASGMVDTDEILTDLPDAGAEAARRWQLIGRLDAASRNGTRERVRSLMDSPDFAECLSHAEGRVALRCVGRMLLRDGDGDLAFDLYRRHLAAVDDEGSRRDAEFLLEESLRRADRGDVTLEDALARLERAAAFAEECSLDARARSKVDRKAGRIHQLEANWESATECYHRALERLPADDPYRSVLVGDLALATLGVRGTLDLLPDPARERRDEAIQILEAAQDGEGRSYNAIYTLGMLAYEQGEWEKGARHLREADDLMRENRAKARIVHARSRFFLAHCLLEQGVEGDDLDEAQRWITRNAGAVSLEPEFKGPVFDALLARVPDARVPGRPSSRAAGGGRTVAPQHLEGARTKVAEGDARAALELVDRAFKSRPDFDTWFGAYRVRLEALLALGERDEALRTYERFRAKLYQREALSQLEAFLQDDEGPLAELLDDAARDEQLADLYDVMPDRKEQFAEVARRLATGHLESGEPERIRRAIALLTELASRDGEGAGALLEKARADAGDAIEKEADREETRTLLGEEEDPVRILIVGGDAERRDQLDRLESLAREYGFEGRWVVTGLRPPYKTLREIANHAQDSDVMLLHHAVGRDMREEVRRIGEKYDVPVREAPWLGSATLEYEVFQTLKDAFED